jgi:hypothetical protein
LKSEHGLYHVQPELEHDSYYGRIVRLESEHDVVRPEPEHDHGRVVQLESEHDSYCGRAVRPGFERG